MSFKLNDMHKAMDDVFFTVRDTENLGVDEAFAMLGTAIRQAAVEQEPQEVTARTQRAYDLAKCLRSWSQTDSDECAVPKVLLSQIRKDTEDEQDLGLISTTEALVHIGKMLGTIEGEKQEPEARDLEADENGGKEKKVRIDKMTRDSDTQAAKGEAEDKRKPLETKPKPNKAETMDQGGQSAGVARVEWNFDEGDDDWGPDPEWLKQ